MNSVLKEIEEIILREDFQIHTVCVMAVRDFSAGNFRSGLARLRIDMDKWVLSDEGQRLNYLLDNIETCPVCKGDGKARAWVNDKVRIVSVLMCTTQVFCAECQGAGVVQLD